MALARIGDQKILLIAGKSASDPRTAVFRIGVPEGNAWPAGTGYGSATPGLWARVQVSADDTSTRSRVATDGSVVPSEGTQSTEWNAHVAQLEHGRDLLCNAGRQVAPTSAKMAIRVCERPKWMRVLLSTCTGEA